MNTATRPDWTEANQRLLAAEFVRIKSLLGDADGDRPAETVEETRMNLPGPGAIDILSQTFGLSPFERDLLLLTAGVEMDAKLAARCGEALGQPQRPWATFGLALATLPDPHWSALAPVRPLRRWRLIEIDESAGVATARLRVDECVLHYLAGVRYLDSRLQPFLRLVRPPHLMAADQERIALEIERLLAAQEGPLPVIQLSGDDEHGQEDVAASAAERLGVALYAIAAAQLPSSHSESDRLATLWEREAALSGSALLIEKADDDTSEALLRFVERTGGVIVIAGREPKRFRRSSIRFKIDRPESLEQRRLWREALGAAGEKLDGVLDGVAGQYRLSARSIAAASTQIAPLLNAANLQDPSTWKAVLSTTASPLGTLAQRIEPLARWDDLILPQAQKMTLRQIATHVRHRIRVHDEWGFAGRSARGLGIGVLFCGESGTGKTMAAEVLAVELGLELYRIDLSAVVSKYIGETEKNLRRVFDAAEETGAILLFDEADALFGKRSDVKDSHDRYANIEVSYLLQRMEAYRGLAILTTNMKGALDTAFQRRLRFVVQFPFPDQEQRALIWRGIFPTATPLEGVAYDKLARLNVPGGNIRNIALNAAFFAAEEEQSIGMRHLLQAARNEAGKGERMITEAETRGWV